MAEAGGGALLVAGLATPLAASALTGVMTVAIQKVHLEKGPWNTEGGYEYPAVLTAAAFMITADGPGAFSLDRRVWGTRWAIAELAAGVAGAFAMLKFADQGDVSE
jgi:putative oxidoreductase